MSTDMSCDKAPVGYYCTNTFGHLVPCDLLPRPAVRRLRRVPFLRGKAGSVQRSK